jgi:hypothetical protein
MKTTKVSTVVTISAIRANWSLKSGTIFRIAVKTFQTPNWLILSLSFCFLLLGESLKHMPQHGQK